MSKTTTEKFFTEKKVIKNN